MRSISKKIIDERSFLFGIVVDVFVVQVVVCQIVIGQIVFDFFDGDALERVVRGEAVGTLVS